MFATVASIRGTANGGAEAASTSADCLSGPTGGRIWTAIAQEQAFYRLALLHSLSRFSSYTRVVQPHAAGLLLQAEAASNPLRRVFF